MRLPVLLIILLYAILIATDVLIVNDFRKMSLLNFTRKAGKKAGIWWKVYLVFAILVVALLTVGICLPRRDVHSDITPNMWILYTVMSVVLAQIVYAIFSLLGFIPAIFRRTRWNTGLWIGLPLAGAFFVLIWWGALIGRRNFHVERQEISSPKLPEGFDGYTIAQISDLHLGTWGNDTSFVSNLVDSINALHPDLIVFTGDAVNRVYTEMLPHVAPLSRLSAPDGIYSILGNHDYGDYVHWESAGEKRANLDSLTSLQRSLGWILLDNTSTFIRNERGDSITIIGVGNWGEPPFTTYGDLNKAFQKDSLFNQDFKILLSHNPEHWNQVVSNSSNIDLTLSGHTHAMQMIFSAGGKRWSPAEYRYKYWGGLYSRQTPDGDISNIYVNIGAGEVGIPMRIGADPEITLFTLRKSVQK